jgi:hypothetical protein
MHADSRVAQSARSLQTQLQHMQLQNQQQYAWGTSRNQQQHAWGTSRNQQHRNTMRHSRNPPPGDRFRPQSSMGSQGRVFHDRRGRGGRGRGGRGYESDSPAFEHKIGGAEA